MVRLYKNVEKVCDMEEEAHSQIRLSSEQMKETQSRDSQVYLLYNVYSVNLREVG